MVDEFDGEEYDLGAVAASAGTPPFLTERRVVVVRRSLERFTTDEARALTAYLQTRSTRPTSSWRRPARRRSTCSTR